ncbi:hypothetical protein AX14_003249 [Amanita brunnescens Koide BX004]|nr:hypothetical protein AX14_003249 [Amanita brunnescens Koide BX004]
MNRSLHLSESFVISCGTVTLDIDQSKVLVIYLRKTGEYCLPKGRKNVGEQLEAASVRETYEETGYNVELLPLQLTTLATLPGHDSRFTITGGTTEPVAVTQRTNQGVLKIIFWYAARGDSSAIRQMNTTDQVDEDFDAVWCPMDEVVQLLTFQDDKTIAARVIETARGGAVPAVVPAA